MIGKKTYSAVGLLLLIAALTVGMMATPSANKEKAMQVENLVGVMIEDQKTYDTYRQLLAPVLASYGAEMLMEVRVEEVLAGPRPYNQLFLMRFPSVEKAGAFSKDNKYLSLRDQYFTPSVSNTVLLGRFMVAPSE